ncbi:hypothetical protein [Lutispora thermophila]|uniref:Uncharacterized protein n=1 Tax=Lutispora thermophila DSM 19022 TaxID=1122184 RepID=A0A1M6ATT4_9FIRM|nr:hypothetical protein [Lutispora thermophila]SHI39831.1 hypothetical protein SAMN02745176_00108 [Lutispora thermophila DSM 19022]
MLLREFEIDGCIIRLSEVNEIFIAEVLGQNGEKLFYHEFNNYDNIKNGFNQIIEENEASKVDIERVLSILENSK